MQDPRDCRHGRPWYECEQCAKERGEALRHHSRQYDAADIQRTTDDDGNVTEISFTLVRRRGVAN